MGKATLARQRAIGLIGGGRVRTLEKHGIALIDAAALEQLRERVAELERRVQVLRAVALESLEESRADA